MARTICSRLTDDAEWSARRSMAVLVVILLTAGLRSTLLSISKPFWFDEICTVLVSRLRGASAIWSALKDGADGQPPVYYLVERFARHLVGYEHLGYRFPSILGVLATVTCIYFILAKRVNRLTALVGASFVLCTALSDYAAEARPYALLVACVAAAILAWQRVEDSQLYALALAACLAAAALLHYYAAFFWPAFVLAEASVLVLSRRFRWSVWAALLLGASPLLILGPLMLQLRQYYGTHFWSLPSIPKIYVWQDLLFKLNGHWAMGFSVGVTAILLFQCVKKAKGDANAAGKSDEGKTLQVAELTLCLALLWLPVMEVALALLFKGGMTERYMMPAVVGGALALGYAIDKLPTPGRGLLLFVLFLQYALPAIGQVKSALHGSIRAQRISAAQEFDRITDQAHEPDLPVVISDGLQFLPLVYYAPEYSKARLFAIANPSSADLFSAASSDSVDLNLLGLQKVSPMQVEDYTGFLSTHRQFILVSSGDWDFQWLPTRLMRDGYIVRLTSAGEPNLIFKVSAAP